mgnify:CR=1 FL=1
MGVFLVISLWSSRSFWRETVVAVRQPTLPAATAYRVDSRLLASAPVSTSTRPVRLPTSVNLAVPFLAQAPRQNWDLPYQEACEEASMIMVDAYLAGRVTAFAADEGDRAILKLVHFETEQGLEADLTAKQVSELIPTYFAQREARVIQRPTIEAIRRLLAQAIPDIVPAYGKALQNPN